VIAASSGNESDTVVVLFHDHDHGDETARFPL
jgi:hypothetical protein